MFCEKFEKPVDYHALILYIVNQGGNEAAGKRRWFMGLWNLDENGACNDAKRYWAKIQNTPHSKFAVGEKIEFFTGHNDDIRAVATIKAISGDELYVYSDCYWYPIKDDQRRKIKKAAA